MDSSNFGFAGNDQVTPSPQAGMSLYVLDSDLAIYFFASPFFAARRPATTSSRGIW